MMHLHYFIKIKMTNTNEIHLQTIMGIMNDRNLKPSGCHQGFQKNRLWIRSHGYPDPDDSNRSGSRALWCSGKRARELFDALDDDGNGFLTEEEFVQVE